MSSRHRTFSRLLAVAALVLLAAPLAAQVSDNFTRADNVSLGSNWTENEGQTADFEIVSNQLRVGDTNNAAMATWTGSAFANDQSVTVTFASNVGGGDYNLSLLVRGGGTRTTATGYVCQLKFNSGAGTTQGAIDVLNTVNLTTPSSGTQLNGMANVGFNLAASDTFGCSVSGTTITLLHNGTSVFTAGSGGTFTSGVAGVVRVASIAGGGAINAGDVAFSLASFTGTSLPASRRGTLLSVGP